MIQAKVIADSISVETGKRITTMVVTMPRIILAEFNTHRMFSRNSASSRAIPFEKMVNSVESNPFVPIAFQKEHSGMQGSEYWTDKDIIKVAPCDPNDTGERNAIEYSIDMWHCAKRRAVDNAWMLHDAGVTKQLCNRLLEPFMWHTVIVTATEWENFFALRCPQYVFELDKTEDGVAQGASFRSWKDAEKSGAFVDDIPKLEENEKLITKLIFNKGQAEIHMMALAEAMWDAYNSSKAKLLRQGDWHIPFGDEINVRKLAELIPHEQRSNGDIVHSKELEEAKVKVATAMCARVSYTVVGEEGKEPNYENDIKLHDKLAKSGHWSPFEHCARAMNNIEYNSYCNGRVPYVLQLSSRSTEYIRQDGEKAFGWSGNFRGFIQYRKTFNKENITI